LKVKRHSRSPKCQNHDSIHNSYQLQSFGKTQTTGVLHNLADEQNRSKSIIFFRNSTVHRCFDVQSFSLLPSGSTVEARAAVLNIVKRTAKE